jgi:hypothetical protein
MIKKILLTTAMILALEIAVVQWLRPWIFPHPAAPPNMFQANLMTAQDFIYNKRDSQIVIVGSSLAGVLAASYLPERWFNLGLGGYGLYDGLTIVERSGATPRILLVETNVLDRLPSPQLTHMLFMPGLFWLRRHCPALREENQPVFTLVFPFADKAYARFKRLLGKAANVWDDIFPSQTAIKALVPGRAILIAEQGLRLQLEAHNQIPDEERLAGMVGQLKIFVDHFRQKGTRTVFFEMPENVALRDSNRLRVFRRALSDRFPPAEYAYVPSPDWSDFTTSDGLHLDPESTVKYAKFLEGAVARYLEESAVGGSSPAGTRSPGP